jgi:hypothetical protein
LYRIGGRSAFPAGWRYTTDQDAPGFIHRQTLALDEFVFERCQVRVIELELELEGAICQTAPLAQQSNRLIQDRDKVHRVSSLPGVLPVGTCAAPS